MALTKASLSQFISTAILWFKDSSNRHAIGTVLVDGSGSHIGISGSPVVTLSSEQDSVSGAQVMIDFMHHELHDGDAYGISIVNADLDSDNELSIAFIAPNSTKRVHMFFFASNTSAGTFEILEIPTITAGSGSQIPVYNRERNSENTSLIRDIAGVVNKATKTPTITNDGTVLHTDLIGSGKSKISGEYRSENERILKQNTLYVFRLTGNADNGRASLQLTWYEHVSEVD